MAEKIYSTKLFEFTANSVNRKFEFSHGENAEGEEFVKVKLFAADPAKCEMELCGDYGHGKACVVYEDVSYSRTAAEDVSRETLYALYDGLADELWMTAKEVAAIAFDLCEFAHDYSDKF